MEIKYPYNFSKHDLIYIFPQSYEETFQDEICEKFKLSKKSVQVKIVPNLENPPEKGLSYNLDYRISITIPVQKVRDKLLEILNKPRKDPDLELMDPLSSDKLDWDNICKIFTSNSFEVFPSMKPDELEESFKNLFEEIEENDGEFFAEKNGYSKKPALSLAVGLLQMFRAMKALRDDKVRFILEKNAELEVFEKINSDLRKTLDGEREIYQIQMKAMNKTLTDITDAYREASAMILSLEKRVQKLDFEFEVHDNLALERGAYLKNMLHHQIRATDAGGEIEIYSDPNVSRDSIYAKNAKLKLSIKDEEEE